MDILIVCWFVQVRETVRDVVFLHNELFFAAAQKKYACFIFIFLMFQWIVNSYALNVLVFVHIEDALLTIFDAWYLLEPS